MPDRHKDFVLHDQRALAVSICAGNVTYIVAIRFEPLPHGILSAEKPCGRVRHVERPVVTNFESACGRSSIETATTIIVVSMPGGVACLHKYVRMAGVIAHDKNDYACFTGIQPHKFGKIDSRGGVTGHRPRRRYSPVAAIG